MKRFSILSGIVLACATSMFAADEGPKPDELFKQLDTNGDGKLAADEIPDAQKRFFDRLVRLGDGDRNGELTREEFTKATAEGAGVTAPAQPGNAARQRPGGQGNRQGDPAAFFRMLDRNGDGKVERSELPEQAKERLGRIFDQLGKDSLTLEDLTKLRQRMEGGQTGGRPGQNSGQQSNPAEMFRRLDSNGDGKLTRDEVPEQARRMIEGVLERSGKGRDGSINEEEFAKAVAQYRSQQSGGRPGQGNRPSQNGRQQPSGDRPSQGNRPPAGPPGFMRILDENQDGKLSRNELAKAASLIDRLDRNGDGALDPRELFGGGPDQGSMNRSGQQSGGRAGERPRRPEGERPENGQRSQKDGERTSAARRPADGRTGADRLEENFRRMDQNGDGSLSRDEAPERLKGNFDRVDSNSDGKVTLEELRAIFQGRSKK